MRSVLVVALLVVAVPLPATAQLTDAGPFTLASLGLKGQAIFKNFSSFSEAPNDTRHFRNEGRLQVEWARRLASWMDARVVVEARKDDNDYADGVSFQIPETSVHHSVVDLKEAVVRLGGGPAELAVGKQIFAWGTADAFNPTDLVNPRDYLDILDNEKLGVWSVAGRAMLGPASLTTVVVPVFTPSRLPLPDRRWTPPPPSGFVAVVDNRELPERDVDGMQYAARLHGTLAGWDVSVSYYDGFKSTPAFRESSIAVAPGIELPRLTPVFTRIRAPGVDWSTTFAKLEFHGEAVARFATANGRDDRFQGIVGINYTWDALGLPWLDAVTAILEYGRETVLATHDRTILKPGDAGVVGDLIADNAFRDALVGRVELKLTEDTRVKLMEIVDLATTPSHYTQVKLAQRLGDAWSFETGVDVLSGGRRTFWGRWRDNDRVFFWLKYLF